jgi:hypothetical protein
MAWVPELPSISDDDWEKLSDAEQTRYNRLVGLKDEYNEARTNYETSMSLVGPAVLAVIGIPCLLFFYFGVILIIAAIIWAFFRVASRSQAYLRYKDAESALRAALADWEATSRSLPRSLPPTIPVIVPAAQVSEEPVAVQVPNPPDPKDKRRIIIVGAIIGVVVVAIIFGGVFVWNNQDWNAYCTSHYPGSHYNAATSQCEGATGSPSSSAVNSSTSNGDQAAINKMSEMNNWMSPTVSVIGDSLSSGEYTKAGLNAVLLRNYIDQNLPTMQQLANSATTKKAAAQEYLLYLNDLRSASNKVAQATDKYNAGNYEDSTNIILSGMTDLDNAKAHLTKSTALL